MLEAYWIESLSHDAMKITVSGVEIRIGRRNPYRACNRVRGEQSKMADEELVAMDLSRSFSICTDFLTVE